MKARGSQFLRFLTGASNESFDVSGRLPKSEAFKKLFKLDVFWNWVPGHLRVTFKSGLVDIFFLSTLLYLSLGLSSYLYGFNLDIYSAYIVYLLIRFGLRRAIFAAFFISLWMQSVGSWPMGLHLAAYTVAIGLIVASKHYFFWQKDLSWLATQWLCIVMPQLFALITSVILVEVSVPWSSFLFRFFVSMSLSTVVSFVIYLPTRRLVDV